MPVAAADLPGRCVHYNCCMRTGIYKAWLYMPLGAPYSPRTMGLSVFWMGASPRLARQRLVMSNISSSHSMLQVASA